MEYMKRKRTHMGASPLTCRSILNIGRISLERRVALMLHCLRSRVDPPMPYGSGAMSEEVDPHAWLDAPDQFANDVCFRLALLRRRRGGRGATALPLRRG